MLIQHVFSYPITSTGLGTQQPPPPINLTSPSHTYSIQNALVRMYQLIHIYHLSLQISLTLKNGFPSTCTCPPQDKERH